MKNLIVLFITLLAEQAATAGLVYPGQVEYSAGQGENQVTIVIDFNYKNYFLFNYRFDGPATGWDALAALEQAGSLEVNATWYEQFQSHFVNDFFYPGSNKYDYGDNTITGWGYWGSSNGESWLINPGVDSRNLSDGGCDAWVWSNYDFDISWDPLRGPGQMPIPEPATILLIGLGSICAIRKRSSN